MQSNTRLRRGLGLLAQAFVLVAAVLALNAETARPIELENEHVKYVIAADGSNSGFVDKKSGTDYCDHKGAAKFARLRKAGKQYGATQAT